MEIGKRTPEYLEGKTCCPRKGCPAYREKDWAHNAPFKEISDYAKHMRTVHVESDYPCTVPGCDRVGAKGYFRKIDLRKHMKRVHDIDRLEDDSE
jgi:predicted small metal-binding protein